MIKSLLIVDNHLILLFYLVIYIYLYLFYFIHMKFVF
jgi:hypothetical protein